MVSKRIQFGLAILAALLPLQALASSIDISVGFDETLDYSGSAESFATIHGHASDNGGMACSSFVNGDYFEADGTHTYNEVIRYLGNINTSTLPDDAIIDSAVLHYHGHNVNTTVTTLGTPKAAVFEATPASTSSYTATDYAAAVATPTRISNEILYSSWDVNGWNDFTFNSTGLSYINKTGTTSFSILESTFDAANSDPLGTAGDRSRYYLECSGIGGNDPYISITYHEPSSSSSSSAAPVSTGSLIIGHSYCEDYTYPTYSGSVVVTPAMCDVWGHSIEIQALLSMRTEAGHIAFATLVLAIKWFIILALLYLLGRFAFRIMTHYRSTHRRR